MSQHELETRFWAAFGGILHGTAGKPQTDAEWIAAGKQLRGLVDLDSLAQRFTAAANQPAQPSTTRKRTQQAGSINYNSDGDPCCPIHDRPLKEGRYGFYCSAKDPNGKNGYCDFKVKEV